MASFAKLDEKISVAGQITPADVAELAASGFKVIVNNRPDGEAMFGQPAASEVEAEAQKHGLGFVNLPFSSSTLTPGHVVKFAEVLQTADGPILAYCRTGTRSTMLWAAASVALGKPVDEVIAKAAAAGYNLGPNAPAIEALARAAKV